MNTKSISIITMLFTIALSSNCTNETDHNLTLRTKPMEDPSEALTTLQKANLERYGAIDLTPAEKAAMEPDLPADKFEFLGYIDEIPFEELPKPIKAFLRNNEDFQEESELTPEEHEAQAKAEFEALENKDGNGDLLVSLFADGRIFKEKPGHRPSHPDPDNLRSTESDVSEVDPKINSIPTSENDGSDELQFRKWYGSDGRTLKTSSSPPWSKVGIRLESDCPGCTNVTNPAPLCSGTAVGPRHIITAAHCLKGEDFGTRWLTASPAGRGTGYSGNLYPFGRRDIVARYWPSAWSGSNSASAYYDYSTIVMDDINWSPGWIAFGTQYFQDLDYKDINSAGYPGRTHTCADSPLSNGKCEGYMYRQFETTKAVTAGTVYHRHDTQTGNSGMSLYDSVNGSRTVRAIHHGVYAGHNAAHRIRSGSYDAICEIIEDHPSSWFTYGGC